MRQLRRAGRPPLPDAARGHADEAAAVCAELADVSGRLRRFEPVSEAEIEASKARKEAVVEAIDPGFYERRGWRVTLPPRFVPVVAGGAVVLAIVTGLVAALVSPTAGRWVVPVVLGVLGGLLPDRGGDGDDP